LYFTFLKKSQSKRLVFNYFYKRHFFKERSLDVFLCLPFLLWNIAYCNPIASISSSVGDFDIELFDDSAPLTVANFIRYAESGRYNGTVIHRSVPDFVVQGGWLTYESESNSLIPIKTDSALLNEFRLSNIRGTVAMAKVGGDPNSATSQWFINLSDNSKNLDNQNGGFTVFGRVIGNGITVADEISSLKTYTLDTNTVGRITNFPLKNYTQGKISSDNFAMITKIDIQSTQVAPNYFDSKSSELRLTLDAGSAGMATLSLLVDGTESPPLFKLVLNSIQRIYEPALNMAIFEPSTGSLAVPELYVAGEKVYKNLLFFLEDPEQYTFVLESYEKI